MNKIRAAYVRKYEHYLTACPEAWALDEGELLASSTGNFNLRNEPAGVH